MNLATIIVLLIVTALVVVAVLALRKGNGCCNKQCRDTHSCVSTSNKCMNCNSVSCPFKR